DLESNHLKELPPQIGQLTNLQELDLSENQLVSLPAEIGKLTKLRSLTLMRNELTSLPAEMGQLKNLEILDLESNHLKELPPQIGQLTNLQELDLEDNPLASLPIEITRLPRPLVIDILPKELHTLENQLFTVSNAPKQVIELIAWDILLLEVDAIVISSSTDFLFMTGNIRNKLLDDPAVKEDISKLLQDESEKLELGNVVATSGGKLGAKRVFYALLPMQEVTGAMIFDVIQNALLKAKHHNLMNIAIPALKTGHACASSIVKAVLRFFRGEKYPLKVFLVSYSRKNYDTFRKELDNLNL
ncbi:MAG: leucine-rich repeat domain-containing protein, partial [Candidatus Odinarchaeota archaeon]